MSSDEESTNEYESEEEQGSEEEVEEVPKKRKTKPKKDPNKPKRNMSAFFLYSNANRARIKEENPGIAFGKVAQLLSKEFKKLDPDERAEWNDAATKDKERYQEEMKSYDPPSDEEDYGGGRRRKKAKKDPNKPKRNMSAFFLYSNAVRSTVKEENPEAKFGDIAKIISVQFKALSDSERAKYNKLAAEDKVRYQEAMVEYNENN